MEECKIPAWGEKKNALAPTGDYFIPGLQFSRGELHFD
jgi:hypothetical protein